MLVLATAGLDVHLYNDAGDLGLKYCTQYQGVCGSVKVSVAATDMRVSLYQHFIRFSLGGILKQMHWIHITTVQGTGTAEHVWHQLRQDYLSYLTVNTISHVSAKMKLKLKL